MCISLLPPSQKKKRLEQQISETSSEQRRVSLQEQLRKTENNIEGLKQRVEEWQGYLKSMEEDLHQMENKEEEGVLCVYLKCDLCKRNV